MISAETLWMAVRMFLPETANANARLRLKYEHKSFLDFYYLNSTWEWNNALMLKTRMVSTQAILFCIIK